MLWRLLFRGNPDAPPRSMDLLTEIDLQNYENISLLLSTSSFSSCNKNYLQQCIRLALSSHNILIIELVLSSISSSVNSEFLSTLFTEYASDGTLPHIIYFLQQYLSPSELAYHHRQRIKFRQYHHDVSFYVVDPLEPPQLNELKQKLLK